MIKMRFVLLGVLLMMLFCLPCAAQTSKTPQEAFRFAEMVELNVARDELLIDICRQYMDGEHRWKAVAVINRIQRPAEKIPAGTKLFVPLAYLKGTPLEGKVTFVRGDARMQKEGRGDFIPLKVGDMVPPSSNLQTGGDSGLEITFEDETTFLLRADTSVGILKSLKITASNLARDLYVGAGRIVTKVREATGAAPRFNVHTPSAVAAVRGTEFRIGVDAAHKTYAEVLEKSIALSAVGAVVEVNEGEGTFVKKGEPPQAPRKLLPAPRPVDLKAIYNSLPVTISFDGVPGARAYRIITSADKQGKQVLLEKIINPQETFKIAGLADASYYLLTHSIDDAGLEGSAVAFVFAVRVNPLPPMIQLPQAGAQIKGKAAKFEWMSVPDAQKYHLQIATDEEFRNIVADKADITATSHKAGEFAYGTYYFRVASVAADAYQGAWSDPLPFVLVPPETPSMDKPGISGDEISLRTRSFGEGVVYHFQMAREGMFKEILLDHKADAPQITIARPKEAGIYYVRVATAAPDGVISDFSAPQSFEIKERIPYELLGGWLGAVLIFFLLVP